MAEENVDSPYAEELTSSADGVVKAPIGLCFRTGADPNPYPATKAQCIIDGGVWSPGVQED